MTCFDTLKSVSFGSKWSTPWHATSWPSSIILCIVSGAFFAKLAVQNMVALTSFAFRMSKMMFVPSTDTFIPSSRVYSTPFSLGTSNSSMSKLNRIIISLCYMFLIANKTCCLKKVSYRAFKPYLMYP